MENHLKKENNSKKKAEETSKAKVLKLEKREITTQNYSKNVSLQIGV